MNDAIEFFECDGCWENVSARFSRSFHDKWDSGETISGEYCSSCRDTVDSGHSLPNMRGAYRRP